jgi:hypothetical protein
MGGNHEKAVLVGTLDSLCICNCHFQGCSMCLPYGIYNIKYMYNMYISVVSIASNVYTGNCTMLSIIALFLI